MYYFLLSVKKPQRIRSKSLTILATLQDSVREKEEEGGVSLLHSRSGPSNE